MIAVRKARKKGLASKAINLMMKFGNNCLGLDRFQVNISDKNKKSLKLFERKLGFRRVDYVPEFKEWTLETQMNYERFVFEKYPGPPPIEERSKVEICDM